jgi:hypothetical protein
MMGYTSRMRITELALLAGTTLGVACVPMASPDRFAQTGTHQDARPPNCEYQFLSAAPTQPYQEIGIIDAYRSQTRDTSEFMNGIREQVCTAGGDAAIAEKAGNGFYIKATVIKLKG